MTDRKDDRDAGLSSPKKARRILDEDTYTENIERIIERDFFPDLPKLKVQKDFFDAYEQNDVVKLRELQIKHGGKCPTTGLPSASYNTPASFETPEVKSQLDGSGLQQQEDPTCENTSHDGSKAEPTGEKCSLKKDPDVSLDCFLANHTSEDNASFVEILGESERKLRERNAWLFEKEARQEEEQRNWLALPSLEEQASCAPRPVNVDTWTYKPKNAVMYVPDGVELNAKELIEMRKQKQRTVKHENTHFRENPFRPGRNREMLHKAAVHKALVLQGKLGHDGRELTASQSQQVNGFTLIATPSPAPDVEESPFMTWGEIEGTPLNLSSAEINPSHAAGPVFKIPEVPKRDQIAHELAEKASKAHRAKKEAALKQVTRRLTSPSPNMSPLERLHGMSPAAQRLASSRLGVRTHTDVALSASYSPLASRTPGSATPVQPKTPSQSPSSRTPGTSSRTPGTNTSRTVRSSLTDNLLRLPKRKSAADFF